MVISGGLSASARKHLSGEYIRQGLSRGLSPSELYESAEGMPWRIRRQDWFAEARRIQGIAAARPKLRAVPRQYRVSEALHAVSKWPLRSNYRYTMDVTMRNRETGETYSRWVIVNASQRLTVESLIAEAEQVLGPSEECFQEDIQSVKLHSALKRARE